MPARSDITLLPPIMYSEDIRDGAAFDDVFKISALKGVNLNILWTAVRKCAVSQPWIYPPETVSPDDVSSVVTALVRAEAMTKSGHSVQTMRQQFFGAEMREGTLVIDHLVYKDRDIFDSDESKQDSIQRMEMILKNR